MAVASDSTPFVLALSRQGLPMLRKDVSENLTAKGAYVLAEADGSRDVTLIATGSEVEIAVDAAAKLAEAGIKAAVVSAPSLELFAAQDAAYRAGVLGQAPRVAIEAAIQQGWDGIIGENGAFIGMSSFGASAPIADLYREFGITAEAVVDAAKNLIK